MAEIKYLANIDLSKNQLLNAVVQNLASAPTSPSAGQIYFDTVAATVYLHDGTSWLDLADDGVTNLTFTRDGTTVTVVSSSGTNAILPVSTTALAGVMSAADKTKLTGIETSADVTDATNVGAAGAVMNTDTTTAAMSFVIDEDTMVSNSATKLPTQQSVKAYVDGITAANDAMIFKGTIGTGGTLTLVDFNALVVYNAGWTYKVVTAGTYKGVVAEIGDLFMATLDRASLGVDADWAVVQTNIDGAVVGPASAVTDKVVFFDGTSGKLIKDSGLGLSGSNSGDNAVNSLYSGLVSDTGVPAIVSTAGLPVLNTGITEAEVKTILSLENVNNTSDADKPVSTAQQTALDLKANIASPTLTGVPAAPTAAIGTNTTQIATTAYVKSQGYSASTGTVKKTQVDCAAALSTTVTHALGQYVSVDVYRKLTPFDKVMAQVTSTNATTVVVTFNVAPTLGEYVIVVQG